MGVAVSQGIIRAGLTARMIETQVCCKPAFSGRGGLSKETMASASISVWEKAAHSAFCPEVTQFSSSLSLAPLSSCSGTAVLRE